MKKKTKVTYAVTFTREVSESGKVYAAGKGYTFITQSERSNEADMLDAAWSDITTRFGKIRKNTVVKFAPVAGGPRIIAWSDGNRALQKCHTEVFTLERNVNTGEFEIIRLLQEGAL
jgi:hypothetical protein